MNSGGDYKCEVSGEAPSFKTVRENKILRVYCKYLMMIIISFFFVIINQKSLTKREGEEFWAQNFWWNNSKKAYRIERS